MKIVKHLLQYKTCTSIRYIGVSFSNMGLEMDACISAVGKHPVSFL